ncbi:hypothetical protein N7517_008579 [Penicillium concentricum]|uniref:FAD-binding domain-containing protein n=1 Tax=Penicillium concentricum TaxID=293559 RepID=A0A9W9V1T5_9EURO|nr:uncharacterized protein N7517_008579 [Penicillium concentricum]KAJ5365693.1 hypothetical protein N7517_008579 [Penicillium concentricum]
MFRIAIIGGGIGGLFAALSIRHYCESSDIQIDIYEQASAYKEIGAGVGIGPNAAELVKKLGLLEECLKITGDRAGAWLSFRRYDTGAEVHTVKTPTDGNTTQLSMHRAEFLEILVQAVESRGAANLHTNKHCQTLEDHGDTMSIKFNDGTTVSAELVIGADGIHSVVRSSYMNDSAQYGEMVVYRGLCDMDKIKDSWKIPTFATVFMAPGKHFLTFPISNNKILNVVAFVTTPWGKLGDAKETWTLTSEKGVVQEEFKNFDPAVQAVIENMDANPLKWILFDRKSSPEWVFSRGKVALLGDAAHAMCPHQGAGAGQALEDGYILGRVLQEHFRSQRTTSIEKCLRLYHSIRYPRSERVQMTSRQAGDLYEMKINELDGLSYDAGIPVVKSLLEDRMRWIWGENINEVYEKARSEWGHSYGLL